MVDATRFTMLSLRTNNAALAAQNSITRTQDALSTSITRLSTGYRINSAMDDAAGLQIATRLKAQTAGMTVAMRNTQNAVSMLQTAEGALEEVSTMLVRMKDLATQAADASSTLADKTAMQSEFDTLAEELHNLLYNTTYGGSPLLMQGALQQSALTFQTGASNNETATLDMSGVSGPMSQIVVLIIYAVRYGGGTWGVNMPSDTLLAGANTTIERLDNAIASVGAARSQLGATSNRLQHAHNNLANMSSNTKAAAGRITDVDYAAESANMTSSQMLLQAGTAMLKQTNSMASMVMSLIQQ
jgi:flagellin